MKRICEFCKKEYDWQEEQPKWVKPKSNMKPTDRNAISSEFFCCYKCGVDNKNQKRKATNLKKYGRENIGQIGTLEHKEAMLKKYNTTKTMHNENIKMKIQQTNLKRYGVVVVSKNKEIYNKIKQTNLIKYGTNSPQKNEKIKEKTKQTCQKKYGVNNPLCLESTHKKAKQTKKERYNDENYNNREKAKRTCLIKYNTINYAKTKEKQEKTKQTKKEKYGNENYINITKNKQTKKERYGDENYNNREKCFNTKKKNGTFNTSNPEKEIYKMLLKKFPDTKSQYKSQVYPFLCDFYISSLDLYIEYQGYWAHGKEPYNKNKEEHIILLNEWKIRSENNLQYKNSINTWTIRDPLKRKIAKENKLNWIEFFTMDQFMEWYNKQ